MSTPTLERAERLYSLRELDELGYGGLLLVIMRSGEVREMLMGIIREALSR